MTTASMIERLAWNLSEIAPEFLSEFSRWRECLFCFKFQFGGRKIGEPVDIRDFHFPLGADRSRSADPTPTSRDRQWCECGRSARWLRRNSAFALLRPQRVAMSSSWESGSEQLRHASKPKTCCAVYRHRIPRRHDGVAQSGGRSRNADADAPYYDQKVQSAKLPEFPRTDFTIGSYATARPNGRRRGKK